MDTRTTNIKKRCMTNQERDDFLGFARSSTGANILTAAACFHFYEEQFYDDCNLKACRDALQYSLCLLDDHLKKYKCLPD